MGQTKLVQKTFLLKEEGGNMAENQSKIINITGEQTEDPVIFYMWDEEKKELRYLAHKDEKYLSIVVPLAEIHLGLQDGNSKTGKELLLNTLPGDHIIQVKGRALTNVRGSCQGCCDGCERYCYAIHGAQQHHNSVMPSTIKNLILYREEPQRFLAELRDLLKTEVKSSLKKKKELVFRWHASGEIENYQYLEDMMMIASEFPSIHFYSYTKRFEYIKNYLDTYGDFPANFVWNLSVWKDNLEKSGFPDKYLPLVQRFAWDDLDDDTLRSVPHCPSVAYTPGAKKGHLNHDPFPNGLKRNCKNCGLCWKGKLKGKVIAVYNH